MQQTKHAIQFSLVPMDVIIGQSLNQRTLVLGGSITVWLTSGLSGLDLTKKVKLMFIKHKQSS